MNRRQRCAWCVWLVLAVVGGCDDDGSSNSDPPDTTETNDTADDTTPPDDTALDTTEPADTADTGDVVTGPTGCTPSDTATPDPREHVLGDWTVRVDAATGAWSVTPAGASEPVLQGPPACQLGDDGTPRAAVSIGTAAPPVDNQFGAFQIRFSRASTRPIAGAPTSVTADDAVTVVYDVLDDAGEIVTDGASLVFEPDGTRLRIAVRGSQPEWQSGFLDLTCQPGEAFFGLGTQATGMDLRGGRYPLWTQEQGIGKPPDGGVFPLNNQPEAAYAPMGVWHSSAGYSAVVDHDAYTRLDLCERDPDRLEMASHAALPALVLVPGDSPRERLSAVTELVGRLVMEPPRWVLAPWSDAAGGPDRVFEVTDALRDAGIPASAMWAEDWAGVQPDGEGYRLSYAWAWDPGFFPDLPTHVETLHDDGFAFLAYFNPFVVTTTDMFAEGVDGGYLIQTDDGSPYLFTDPGFRDASLVDLTNPEAVAWLDGYLQTAARDLAIDGWMADFAEWLPVDAELASGESGWNVHNRYPLLWQQANLNAFQAVHASSPDAENNWTFFVRSGWASTRGGTPGLAPTLWAGDQNTDWAYDDGFPTVVPIGAHVGLAGVAIFGHDIAGYAAVVTEPTSKELFFRWTGLGAFSPLMRTHHGSEECANWTFDRDAETTAHFRRYSILHTLLMPLLTTLVAEARELGLPMWRHPWLVEPDVRALWRSDDYQVFLGDDLLLAPVVTEGATTRHVILPSAGWWPLFGDAPLSGESALADAVEIDVDAPTTEIPVFVRPGRALHLLAEPVDSFYGATHADVTDYDDVVGRFRVALYPAADGSLADAVARDLDGSEMSRLSAATGWQADSLATAPSVDGGATALPECAAVPDTDSCYDADATLARVVGTDVTVTATDGATVRLQASETSTWMLAVGRAAWGEWAEPTTLTDLDPEITGPCAVSP